MKINQNILRAFDINKIKCIFHVSKTCYWRMPLESQFPVVKGPRTGFIIDNNYNLTYHVISQNIPIFAKTSPRIPIVSLMIALFKH